MSIEEFVSSAIQSLGGSVTQHDQHTFDIQLDGRKQKAFVSDVIHTETPGRTVYAPGSPAFQRLLARLTQSGLHHVTDTDQNSRRDINDLSENWATSFSATLIEVTTTKVRKHFSGTALIHARATVAHDSYERLVTVPCTPQEHTSESDETALQPINNHIQDPAECGLRPDAISATAMTDDGIAEFCRFYDERREYEIASVRKDQRKRQKLSDEFTPRLQFTLAGLQGTVVRSTETTVSYAIDGAQYTSIVQLAPSASEIVHAPAFELCQLTGRSAPTDTFGTCSQSGKRILRHRLSKSEVSGRLALEEYTSRCSYSNNLVLIDEVGRSDITGNSVANAYLKRSDLSGTQGEELQFGACHFTNATCLLEELKTSDVSGVQYRSDQSAASVVSGKTGHLSEFVVCPLSTSTLLESEAVQCAVTGTNVAPGQLAQCAVSGRMVLPSELIRSDVSGREALPEFIVVSNVSKANLINDETIISRNRRFCSFGEAVSCIWTGELTHPDDIRVCALTGLRFSTPFVTIEDLPYRVTSLVQALNTPNAIADRTDLWPQVESHLSSRLGGKTEIESGHVTPTGRHLLVCANNKKYFGLRTTVVGAVFDISSNAIVGRVCVGRRKRGVWSAT